MNVEQLTIGLFYGAFSYLIGGFDHLFLALCILLVVDYITGTSASAYEGKLSSRRGWWGLFKKVLTMCFIVLAVQLDTVTGNSVGFLRNAVILILITNEGVSITENLGRLGFKVPKPIRQALEKLKDAEDIIKDDKPKDE